ncbi:MFS transporter [Azotosporobacter soli]|uniref:MFS transporter n=1 Tax=Azotosporobacter soli TaxID=3055040 RepID=UPI0031FE70D3
MSMMDFFATGKEKPRIQDSQEVKRLFTKARWQSMTAMIIGYGMYYVTKMTLGVAKKPMLEAGFSATDLGQIGAGLLIAYAVGKCFHGFLGDRCNVKKIVPIGLLGSAVINVVLGFTPYFWAFMILWFLNGWFQSMGSAPCIVSITQWFSKKEVATQYGVFSIAHYIGEGATFIFSAMLIVHFGWQSAFLYPGLACIFIAFGMYKFMYDRPQAYGLPSANEFKGEVEEVAKEKVKTTREAQLEVLKNPYIWFIALSAACMGIARYSINSWGVIYLQEVKAYSLVAAGSVLALAPLMGGVGSFASGYISDKIFKSNHALTTVVFGFVMLVGLVGFCLSPAGNQWLDSLFMAIFGFGLGVILCFIGGMLAVDLCSQKAAGAAMGTVGLLAYAGAAVQDVLNGWLMDSSKIMVKGVAVYNFSNIKMFWIGSVILMIILVLPTLWAKKPKKFEAAEKSA